MAANSDTANLVKQKFEQFNIHNTTYQQVKNHAITTDIFIPKDISPGKHPLIVRFHGGFLITGSSLNQVFFQPWILDYALANSAILVSPNYRKLPESNGLEIMDNLAHFWKWLRSDLQKAVASAPGGSGVEVDQEKTIIIGHSAGGYLAAQSALTQPMDSIRAVIAGYPMVDMQSQFFTTDHADKHPFGRPTLPASLVADHIAAKKPGVIVSGTTDPKRLDLAVAVVQHGKYPELLGGHKSLYPIDTLTRASSFPPLFVFHGKDDTSVELAGTERFVEEVKEIQDKVVVKLEPGDHGFDTTVGVDEPWLKEGLDFVTEQWLQ